MALARRSVRNVSGSIWPGFVDAMTALLLVLMFVLTIFMVVQFVLREQISGQAHELDELAGQVASLADALGLERQANQRLEGEVGALTATLTDLRATSDEQAAAIASFEAQVASLLARQTELTTQVAGLEASEARLIDEREALQLALAQARDEIDAEAEAARLAAARTQAVEALMADLRAEQAETQAALDEAEAARLVDAAALEALRERLQNADDEITAMTLTLEEQRREAEETLTLLAAANAAREGLQVDLDAALSEAEKRAALLATANQALSTEEAASAEAARKVALLNEQMAALRTQLGSLEAVLEASEAAEAEAKVQVEALGSRLNTALAAVAAEQRKLAAEQGKLAEVEAARAALEAAEAERLRAEAKELENYRSEFFGKLRQVLGNREGVRIEGDRFVFSSEVLFDVGGSELGPEGRAQIARVSDILLDVASEIPAEIDWILRVDGHTDATPFRGNARYADNWELSQARALSVVRYMMDELGFPPERLVAAGFGEYQPIAAGSSPEALAANRRIELKLTEK